MEGKILKGRYQIDSLYDSGGMSNVYRGVDIKTGRQVAVKVLKPEFTGNKEYVLRFSKEARAMAQLKHKNIVRMIDSGSAGDIHFIVFEFISGQTLKQRINLSVIPPVEATQIMIDICSAIDHAHSKGLVHRDIKPQNVLIQEELVKLTDFGIAKNISGSTIVNENTEVMGSAHYFSPEQAMGEKIDTRSDIYSLGIVLYEMVTGQLPFDGETSVAVAIKHINEPLREPKELMPDLPKSLNAIILKATRKDKEKRYSSAKELKDDLQHSLLTPDGNFVKIEKDKPKKQNLKRNIIPIAALFVFLAIVLGTVLIIGSNILSNKKNNTVTVPSLVNQTEKDAMEYAANIGMKINRVYEPSNTVDKGVIMEQSPPAEESMDKDSSVTIVISDGPMSFEMPLLIDEAFENAVKLLDEWDLELGTVTYEVADKPKDYVIAQQPEPGVLVTRGDSINLTVCDKRITDFATMPYVRGFTVDEAVNAIAQSGFIAALVYEETSAKEPGVVLEQQPVANVSENIRTMTKLWVSTLADKKFSAITTVSYTVEENDSVVLIVLENVQEGITVNYVLHESVNSTGEFKLPLTVFGTVGGAQDLVVYCNGVEVIRKTVELK